MACNVFTVALVFTSLAMCCCPVPAQSSVADSVEVPADVGSMVSQIDECMAPVWDKMSQATLEEQAHIIGSLFAFARDLVMSTVIRPVPLESKDESQGSDSHFFYFSDDMSQSLSESPSGSFSEETFRGVPH